MLSLNEESTMPPNNEVESEKISAESMSALADVLNRMFSKENLEVDAYLHSCMSSVTKTISLLAIAEVPAVKNITSDINILKLAFDRVPAVNIVDDAIHIQHKPEQNTIILRDIPSATSPDTISSIFSTSDAINGVKCPDVKGIRADMNDTWFVSFATEEDARQALLHLRTCKFNNSPVRARLKTESLAKSYFHVPPPPMHLPPNMPPEFFMGSPMYMSGPPMQQRSPNNVYFYSPQSWNGNGGFNMSPMNNWNQMGGPPPPNMFAPMHMQQQQRQQQRDMGPTGSNSRGNPNLPRTPSNISANSMQNKNSPRNNSNTGGTRPSTAAVASGSVSLQQSSSLSSVDQEEGMVAGDADERKRKKGGKGGKKRSGGDERGGAAASPRNGETDRANRSGNNSNGGNGLSNNSNGGNGRRGGNGGRGTEDKKNTNGRTRKPVVEFNMEADFPALDGLPSPTGGASDSSATAQSSAPTGSWAAALLKKKAPPMPLSSSSVSSGHSTTAENGSNAVVAEAAVASRDSNSSVAAAGAAGALPSHSADGEKQATTIPVVISAAEDQHNSGSSSQQQHVAADASLEVVTLSFGTVNMSEIESSINNTNSGSVPSASTNSGSRSHSRKKSNNGGEKNPAGAAGGQSDHSPSSLKDNKSDEHNEEKHVNSSVSNEQSTVHLPGAKPSFLDIARMGKGVKNK